MRVELSRFIEADLDTIAEYIAQDSPARAVSFIREIRARFRVVGQDPCSTSSGRKSAKVRAWRSSVAMRFCFGSSATWSGLKGASTVAAILGVFWIRSIDS
jgi:hypothetical protein